MFCCRAKLSMQQLVVARKVWPIVSCVYYYVVLVFCAEMDFALFEHRFPCSLWQSALSFFDQKPSD